VALILRQGKQGKLGTAGFRLPRPAKLSVKGWKFRDGGKAKNAGGTPAFALPDDDHSMTIRGATRLIPAPTWSRTCAAMAR
jgi:hypothetical protein